MRLIDWQNCKSIIWENMNQLNIIWIGFCKKIIDVICDSALPDWMCKISFDFDPMQVKQNIEKLNELWINVEEIKQWSKQLIQKYRKSIVKWIEDKETIAKVLADFDAQYAAWYKIQQKQNMQLS